MSTVLDNFLPPVRQWFLATFREPTAPQALGWPPIQRGEHTLILSPTGSGKTLAAFLCAINDIYARLARGEEERGIQLLYVSPLKALNNDIERNLRTPLLGIRQMAARMGQRLPPLRVAVRTGDTPPSARAAMLRHPPHILITTPESLYLILTSPHAREMLSTVRTVIVDEIHTLCGNKRGVHLALSLERLEHLTRGRIQRIGLSATQRPLEEVARFLGGCTWQPADGEGQGEARLVPRAVTIVDAGMKKPLDLQVVTPIEDLRHAPGGSVWSSIIPQVLHLILRHRTTLIFANSRRQAERCADRLNEQYRAESSEEVPPGSTEALSPGGIPKGIGFMGTGVSEGPFRAHHGSISREARLQLEQDLKEGRLPALIGTSSLELGIDIGAVDLVIQLQSPKGIARGLQRVGRSGHLVGQTSVGRFFPTHLEDLLECAAVAQGMLAGDVEPTYTPKNCLDVLAQQIVAMVSVQDWDVKELYDLVRCAYPYQELTWDAYTAVLDMLSGKYPSAAFRELRPRIVWDRVHDRLSAMPGSRMLALRNGGTIPDRGTFTVYLPDGVTKLGELDEEFVFETRPGDVFTLGSQTWRVAGVTEDKVIVTDAAGQMPRMPFWRGDVPYRDYHLGRRFGAFRRHLLERVASLPPLSESKEVPWPEEAVAVLKWLQREYALDENSARNAVLYVQRQAQALGAISSDRTVILETFTDALGDLRLVVHSCFGGRVNSAWALALTNAFRERLGTTPEVQVSDDGILFRFLQADREPPLDVVTGMSFEEARERLLAELPNSALFGAQFRVNAARALMLPGVKGTRRRTPFWLQRLRAKDLLAVAKGFRDFPIVAETYRDCLRDVLDLEHLGELLRGIESGEVHVLRAESVVPSPVAASLLFNFMAIHVYEWDTPKLERQMQALALDRRLVSELLGDAEMADLIRPEAVAQVEEELAHAAEGYRARTREELAWFIGEAGDLTSAEVLQACPDQGMAWLAELAAQGRVLEVALGPGASAPKFWIAAENYALYRDAFGLPARPPIPIPEQLLAAKHTVDEAGINILRRFLRRRGPRERAEILQRYPFREEWLADALARLEASGEIVSGKLTVEGVAQVCDRHVLQRIHQRTLIMLRREVQPITARHYADFVCRWHHLHPEERLRGANALLEALEQLRGAVAPGVVWERDLLPLRVEGFRGAELDSLCANGQVVWVLSGGKDPGRGHMRVFFRGEGALFLEPEPTEYSELSATAQQVLRFLKSEGASFMEDLQIGLDIETRSLREALVELAMAGLVTNDSLETLHEVLRYQIGGRERQPLSALEEQLAEWRRTRPISRLTPGRYREAKRQAAQAAREFALWPGRWSPVYRVGIWGKDISPEERARQQARQLLIRHGVVTRSSLQLEEGPWDWESLFMQFTLMEMRGEVRRGYFVKGLPGIQFALPEALDRLREWSQKLERRPADASQLVLMNACDPANVFCIMSDASAELSECDPCRIPRLPSNYLILLHGVPILGLESAGERIRAVPGTPESVLSEALRLFVRHASAGGAFPISSYRLIVSWWNEKPVLGSEAEPLLASLGFRRDPPHMVRDL